MRYSSRLFARPWLFLCCSLLGATALLAQPAAPSAEASRKDWIPLFNGKDLDGWMPKITGYAPGENFANTFRVVDGLLQVRYDGYDEFRERFGHLFYIRQPYSYYVLAAEYRFVGDQVKGGPNWAVRNSGFMLHGQHPRTMLRDQDFPISIEMQLLGGDGVKPRTTANLCTPGTNVVRNGQLFTPHCLNSTSKTYHGDQWVRVEVLVLGSAQIRHLVEGETVLQYELPQIGGGNVANFQSGEKKDGQLLEGGYISLQSESHPIDFRKVEVLPLSGCMDSKAKNYKTYYVKHEASQCIY